MRCHVGLDYRARRDRFPIIYIQPVGTVTVFSHVAEQRTRGSALYTSLYLVPMAAALSSCNGGTFQFTSLTSQNGPHRLTNRRPRIQHRSANQAHENSEAIRYSHIRTHPSTHQQEPTKSRGRHSRQSRDRSNSPYATSKPQHQTLSHTASSCTFCH